MEVSDSDRQGLPPHPRQTRRCPDARVAWRGRPDEGFALLIVLWTMALLSLLASQVTGAGRAETKLANALDALGRQKKSIVRYKAGLE